MIGRIKKKASNLSNVAFLILFQMAMGRFLCLRRLIEPSVATWQRLTERKESTKLIPKEPIDHQTEPTGSLSLSLSLSLKLYRNLKWPHIYISLVTLSLSLSSYLRCCCCCCCALFYGFLCLTNTTQGFRHIGKYRSFVDQQTK